MTRLHSLRASYRAGFTLVELLMAMLILGEIATFTIPKIINSQQNLTYRAIAKEAAGSIETAFMQYKVSNAVGSSTSPVNLQSYFNYVKVDTSTQIDDVYNGTGNFQCSSGEPCLRLHNGAILFLRGISFNGTASTNSISFIVDPDGKITDGTATGPGHSLYFFLYPNGRIVTFGNLLPGTTDSTGFTYSATPSYDPPWFSWS